MTTPNCLISCSLTIYSDPFFGVKHRAYCFRQITVMIELLGPSLYCEGALEGNNESLIDHRTPARIRWYWCELKANPPSCAGRLHDHHQRVLRNCATQGHA